MKWIPGIGLLIALALSACSASLAVDVTPPPDFVQPSEDEVAATPTAVEVAPIVPPNPQAGAILYTEKCAPCHGETGAGNGPQAASLPNPPTALAQAEIARTTAPADWYRIVTAGNLERFMPGFPGLSDRQRWDVVAYALTLSFTSQDLKRGQEIYNAQCAVCHGPKGAGSTATGASDWRGGGRLASLSGQALWKIIYNGVPEGRMPSFANQLSVDERWAVTDFVRTLGFNTGSELEQTSTQPADQAQPPHKTPSASSSFFNATPEPALITFQGRVAFADGRPAPSGLRAELQAFKDMHPIVDLQAPVKSDGSYEFKEVTLDPEMVYVTLVEYDGLTFNSSMVPGSDIVPGHPVDMPITLHQTTTDTSGLSVQRLHIFFDFSIPERLQVVELYLIVNDSELVVTAPSPGQPIVTFSLPEGAEKLQFQDGALGERYVQTPDGFGDTSSIAPGGELHQVLFAYELPYTRRATLKIVPPLPVEAAMVAVPAGGVKVQSPQLTPGGKRPVDGMSILTYTSGSLAAGSELSIDISGRPRAGASFSGGSQTNLAIGLGVLGLTLIVIGVFFYRRRKPAVEVSVPATPGESVDEILDAIVTLDDNYHSGLLPEAAYRQRRDELKARIRELRGDRKA